MSVVTVDLETSVRCPVGNFAAHPGWTANKIVAAGWMVEDKYECSYSPNTSNVNNLAYFLSNATLVVGANIKFDLLYLFRDNNYCLPTIWDVQLAEYLLTAQQHKYPSLDDMTNKYVGEHALKDDRIKAYWDAGTPTEDIPKAELLEYMAGDVSNTRAIFKEQWRQANHLGMIPLMLSQMDALRATTQMARNGMFIDWEYVGEQRNYYSSVIEHHKTWMQNNATGLDWASPKELSLYFFGGERKSKEPQPTGEVYKTGAKAGQPKTRLTEITHAVTGKYNPDTFGYVVGKAGYYSTDDSVLAELTKQGDEVAVVISKLREYHKIYETYYGNLQGLRFPNGYIYPNLNHTSTTTGRLSCTNPNLQNQTDTGDVKRAYVSRYGDGGRILELDYSQLEMVALAYIADDKQLQDDINNGRDMHRELYKEMYGRYPTDKERKPFKRFSFLLVYGGGVTTLMAQSGCDRATAQRFIKTFYTRYKGVKDYHEHIVHRAQSESEIFYEDSSAGAKRVFILTSPTKRMYTFKQYYNDKRKEWGFSPTELKNYPIQGTATGDIVPLMVGLLQRTLEEVYPDGVHLVMTVHDSVLLDVKEGLVYDVARLAKELLEDAPAYLKSVFNIDFPCRLSCGVEAGTNWQDKIDISKELV
jgi:DNA polymerase I-like protein with 3'-5' exonuclease and polymerase domains